MTNSSEDNRFMDAHKNDIDWQAFCYIAGELDDQELAAFEERLSHDQTARDAVERAVRAGQLVDASFRRESEPAVSRASTGRGDESRPFDSSNHRHRRRRSVSMVASIVAVLALLLGASFLIPASSVNAEVDQDLAAELWVDSLESGPLLDGFNSELVDDESELELTSAGWLFDAFDDSAIDPADEFDESETDDMTIEEVDHV